MLVLFRILFSYLEAFRMQTHSKSLVRRVFCMRALPALLLIAILAAAAVPAFAQPPAEHHSGEAELILPDLGQATFFGGVNGRSLLMGGLLISALGLVFGFLSYTRLRNLPVHK